jgi:hypothetical protein
MSPRRAGLWLASALLLSGCAPAAPSTAPVPESPSPVVASSAAPSTAAATSSTPPVALLKVGDCTGNVDLSGASITSVPTVPCDQPHYYEVHATLPVAGDGFPGAEALNTRAKTACAASFLGYVGVEARYSRYSSAYLAADETAWADPANRVITCLVGSADGGLVGSAKGDNLIFPRKGQCTGPQDVAAQQVKVLDCATAHHYEVFATKEVSGSQAPSAAEEQKLFASVCQAGFKSFVGVDAGKSKYEVTYFLAGADIWSKVADHRIVCSAGSPSGGIKGSLKGVKK